MILYTNGTLITNDKENRIIPRGCLAVDDGLFTHIGAPDECEDSTGAETVDLCGRLVMPGQILAHTHLYSHLARGLAPDGAPEDFLAQLRQMWWRLDLALTLDDVYWSAKGGCLDALLAGTTTIIDHHASPSCIDGSLEAVARGMSEIGVRGALAYEITDRNGAADATRGIEENLRGVEIAGAAPGLLAARIGLHASFTLSEETLKEVYERAAGIGIHVHVAEDWADVDLSRELHGRGVIRRFSRHGLLDRNGILVHGVHLDEEELNTLAGAGAFLVHNPQSNMNNGVGASDLELHHRIGVRLAIGSDGMGPDPSEEALTALLLQRHRAGSPSAAWPLIQRIYCHGNSELATRTFGLPLGRLEVGAGADFVVRRYAPPTPLTEENWWGHFLFGIRRTPVDLVVVAGDELVRDGQPVNLDPGRIRHECRHRARNLWARW